MPWETEEKIIHTVETPRTKNPYRGKPETKKSIPWKILYQIIHSSGNPGTNNSNRGKP